MAAATERRPRSSSAPVGVGLMSRPPCPHENDSGAIELEFMTPGPIGRSRTATADLRRHSSAQSNGSILWRPNTVTSMWEEHVSPTVDAQDCRDYLALERTFLGYLRTSVILALTGVTVTQLYALQSRDTVSFLSYPLIGKPMATCCHASAIGTILLGSYRYWRYQRAMRHDTALSGGFELNTIWMLFLALIVTFLALTITID